MVQQEPILFSRSILDNIRYGQQDELTCAHDAGCVLLDSARWC